MNAIASCHKGTLVTHRGGYQIEGFVAEHGTFRLRIQRRTCCNTVMILEVEAGAIFYGR